VENLNDKKIRGRTKFLNKSIKISSRQLAGGFKAFK